MFAFFRVTSAWSPDRSKGQPGGESALVRASRFVLSGERMGYVTSCRTFKIKFSSQRRYVPGYWNISQLSARQ